VTWVPLSGARQEAAFDLVVLAPGQHPEPFAAAFVRDHDLTVDDRGFIRPAPFSTADTARPGIFACGGCTGPKDIHDSILAASAAALSAMQVMTAAGRDRVPAGTPASDGNTNKADEGSGAASDSNTKTGFKNRSPGVNGPDQPVVPDGPESGLALWPKALVVGGGIAGMTAALGIADQGFEVDLVEKTGALGGNLTWLGPAIEGADEFLARQTDAVQAHDRIRVHLRSCVAETAGRPGQWTTRLSSVSDTGTALPADPAAAPKGLKNPDSSPDRDLEPVVRHGVVVLAVGGTQAEAVPADPVQADQGPKGPARQGPAQPDSGVSARRQGPGIYTQQRFQQALDSKTIDTAHPLQVAMIQCHGSREPGRFYCSRVCCSRSLDQALFLTRGHPETRVVVFYRDMMTIGAAEAAFSAARQAGVVFVPYEPGGGPDLAPHDNGCGITWTDPVLGRPMAMDADYAVLATGMVSGLTRDLAGMFGAAPDRDGFFDQADIKWRPVEAVDPRVLACGLCLEPGGLDLVLAGARAAAAKAVSLLRHKRFVPNPDTARVRAALCSLCQVCVAVCPFNARYVDWETRTLRVDPLLCQGCGVCAAACPSGAAVVEPLSARPMFKAIHAALDNR
jgi:heterodisulfide reductase subunit A2